MLLLTSPCKSVTAQYRQLLLIATCMNTFKKKRFGKKINALFIIHVRTKGLLNVML